MTNGNPQMGNKMQLFSRTNYFLAIYPDGTIKGTQDRDDLHTHLEIVSADFPGGVKIRGIATDLYVLMNEEGIVYGQPVAEADSAVFMEQFQGSYNTYLSVKHSDCNWYIGIKKSGKMKKGPKTKYGQEAIQFLPNRKPFE